jgi:hypothetical protein
MSTEELSMGFSQGRRNAITSVLRLAGRHRRIEAYTAIFLAFALSGCAAIRIDAYPAEWEPLVVRQGAECPDLTGHFRNIGESSSGAPQLTLGVKPRDPAPLVYQLLIEPETWRSAKFSPKSPARVRISNAGPDVIAVAVDQEAEGLTHEWKYSFGQVQSQRGLISNEGTFSCADGVLTEHRSRIAFVLIGGGKGASTKEWSVTPKYLVVKEKSTASGVVPVYPGVPVPFHVNQEIWHRYPRIEEAKQ